MPPPPRREPPSTPDQRLLDLLRAYRQPLSFEFLNRELGWRPELVRQAVARLCSRGQAIVTAKDFVCATYEDPSRRRSHDISMTTVVVALLALLMVFSMLVGLVAKYARL